MLSFPSAVAVADFNHDGKLDLATGAPAGGLGLSVLLGNGDGTFQAAVNYNSGATFGNNMVAGDFNGDKAPDLALVTAGGITVLLNTRGAAALLTSSKNPLLFRRARNFHGKCAADSERQHQSCGKDDWHR